MSYDLVVKGGRKAKLSKEFAATAVAGECEVSKSGSGVVVSMPKPIESVQVAFETLIRLCKTHGCTLYDTWAGANIDLDNPPTLPPGYGPETSAAPQPSSHQRIQVRFPVHNLELETKVYCESFGAALVRQTEQCAELDLLGVRICLIPGKSRSAKVKFVEDGDQRLFHNTLVIELSPSDYDDMVKHLQSRGVYFTYQPTRRSTLGGEPCDCFTIADRSGNFIEVRQGEPIQTSGPSGGRPRE